MKVGMKPVEFEPPEAHGTRIEQADRPRIAALKVPGRHADGGGLYLRITTGGARSWVFMTTSNGKRAEIGIGPAVSVSLAAARRIAGEMREAVAVGQDPRGVLGTETLVEKPAVLTFGAFADQYISSVEDGWRNPVHRQQWRNSLRDHAAALQNVPVTDATSHPREIVEQALAHTIQTKQNVLTITDEDLFTLLQ